LVIYFVIQTFVLTCNLLDYRIALTHIPGFVYWRQNEINDVVDVNVIEIVIIYYVDKQLENKQ